mmetsp:Transcript_17591/g.30820  ORF Transcript_17591/g.30820 Transcript_17591/m.30820 type:complete len:620 (+) Transcript_17591:307-2166(+)
MQDRKVIRGRKLHAMHEIIDGPPPDYVEKAKYEETVAQHKEDSDRFFKELEHLRRGMHKLVDACRAFMPASTLRALQESLQLDVRYFTTPAQGEGGPLPPLPPVEDQSALIEKLRAKIADQDDKIEDQERLIQQLQRELEKALEKLRAIGVEVPSAPIKRQLKQGPQSVQIQTDPWMPPRGQDGGTFDADEDSDDPITGKKKVKKGPGDPKEKRARRPGEDGEDDGPTRVVDGGTGGQVVQKVFQKGGGPGETTVVHTGADPEELRRLQAELELLRMKLAAAERQLKEMDALKAEIEELKRLLAAKDAELAALRAQIAKLQALLDSRGGGGKADEAPAGKKKKEAEETDKKKKKKASGAVEATGGKGGTVLKPDAEKPEKRKLITDDGEVVEEEESEEEEEESESEEEKVMVDVCVGNGPGKGMSDEPIRMRGRAVFKDDEEMNKTGKVYDRSLTSQPALGLTNSPDFTASTPPEGMARSLPSRGNMKSRGFGAGVYAGGSGPMGGVQFATSWSSKSTGSLFNTASTWAEAEPYLQQVWETNPKGHRLPAKRELVKLGALSPQQQQKQSDPMARTLPSLSPDSSPMSNWPAQRPPRTAGGALERSKGGFTLKDPVVLPQ